MGVGMGLTIPTTNLLVSELNPRRRAAALNFVNLAWGLGAVLCPFLVAGLDHLRHLAWLPYGVAAFLVLLTVILARATFPDAPVEKQGSQVTALNSRIWRSRFVPILGALFFIYVGSETSVGGWIATYAHRTMANPGTKWEMMPAFFWAALLGGRAIAPAVLRKVSEIHVAQIGLTMAGVGVVLLLLARNGWALAASVALSGLGFSSVYPIAIAMLSHKFGKFATRIGGLTFTLAGIGGATLPWLVGYLSTSFGRLEVGLLVPLIGCISMLLLSFPLSTKSSTT
jgi:fucose permease